MTIELTHGGLFEGIGGFSLAARWAGIKTVWQVENNEWCTKLLNKHFPEAEKHGDIKETRNLRTVDIITGGFPCQPFSVAGKRKGAEDDRALWPEMLRVIKESKPSWVIGENVDGIISMELHTVLSDLEGEGFETQTFIIPACGINAWHRRNRVWILAYSAHNRWRRRSDRQSGIDKREFQQEEQEEQEGREVRDQVAGCAGFEHIYEIISQSYGFGSSESGEEYESEQFNKDGRTRTFIPDSYGSGFKKQQQPGSIDQEREWYMERQSAIECGSWWQTEPGVGRVVHGLPCRVDRLRGLGNSIVPEIAYIFYMLIRQIEAKLS